MSGDTKNETKVSEDTKNEDNNKEPKDDAVAEAKSKAAVAATQDAGEAEPTKESTGEMLVETAATEIADNDGMKTEDDKPAASGVEVKVDGDGKLLKDLDDEAPKTFPQVLMDILGNEEDSDTIAWLPHGRSFIIYKKKKFAQFTLPRHFKATKFTSFTRKLNRWGFTRVTRGPEMGSYYHKLFLRDEASLCLRMSSHSSSKFQEQQQLMPNPMGGMPFGAMPFGMPGMMPGMMNPMNMNPADINQQNQLIQQQLQQLQWQQFQLQQLQQQHQQAQGGMNGGTQQPHHPNQPPPHHHPQGHPQQGHPQGHQQPGPPMMHGPPPHPHGPGGPPPPHAPNPHAAGGHAPSGHHAPNPHSAGGHAPPGSHPHPSSGPPPPHTNGVPPHHQVSSPPPPQQQQQQQQRGASPQQQQHLPQQPPQMMVPQNQSV